jgi:hypothetical protein
MSADQQFDELKTEMIERLFKIRPEFASFMGLHEPYDNLWSKGDLTPEKDVEKLIEEFVQRMKETIAFNELSVTAQIEWEFMEMLLPLQKFFIYEQRQLEQNPDAFFLLGYSFFMMIAREYAPLEVRLESVANRIERIPQYLEEFRSRFSKTPPVKLWTEIAIETVQQITGLFQFLASFAKGQIPEQSQKKLEKAVSALENPLKEHITWLQQLQSKAVDNWALGKDRFDKLLEMTSDEILEFGINSLNTLKDERRKIATQINPDKDVDEVLKMIQIDCPETFDEALVETREVIQEAKQFIIDNDIVTLFPQDELNVEETPAYLAVLIPMAAMIPAAIYDQPPIGLFVITRQQNLATNGSQHLNYQGIRLTAVHEGFPGHFLQGSVSLRETLITLFSSFTLFTGAETSEGWAMYCEEMMLEKGFIQGPEAKMIIINAAIFRAVRIILDVRLSWGEMTIEEAVEMLMKETGMTKEIATSEVRRYTGTPGLPLSYLLGKHLILRLRDEIKEIMGEKYSEKFFHDTITTYGDFPVSMIRTVFDRKIAKMNS